MPLNPSSNLHHIQSITVPRGPKVVILCGSVKLLILLVRDDIVLLITKDNATLVPLGNINNPITQNLNPRP